ncbi:MAG: radical SAM protein [Euryarchaeota archaeon]
MLVPSLACPAHCNYCFGPNEGGPVMSIDIVEAVSRWQSPHHDPLEVTFHGGEPLVAGTDFYRNALPLLQDTLAHRRVRFSVQSNLWLLTDELCAVFKNHNVSIGTSLYGPEHITDAQRGRGYYKRTMKGIERARSHGIEVGCICTFTPSSLPDLGEIFDFFMSESLHFTIHACMPSLHHPEAGGWALSAGEHGQLLADSLAIYLENLNRSGSARSIRSAGVSPPGAEACAPSQTA